MLITISWKAWSGKSSVAKILAEKLGYEYISIWNIKRALAEKMGINIAEFNALGTKPENIQSFDLKYEDYQKSLPTDGKIILESRLGFFCQPKAFKVFLTVSDQEAAQRIFAQKRTTDQFTDFQKTLEVTNRRNEEDKQRYENLYGINREDEKNYNFVLDTTGDTIDWSVQKILAAYQKFLNIDL